MATDTASPKPGAKEQTAAAPATAGARPTRRLIVMIAAAAVLAAASLGAGAFFALRPRDEAASEPAAKAEKADKKGKKDAAKENKGPAKPAQFVNLEVFTVNLRADQDGDRYLQLGVVYEIAGSDANDALKASMPAIRSRILLALTSKSASDLQTTEGKTRLAEELLGIARATLPGAGDKGVAAAHFSAFVIQ